MTVDLDALLQVSIGILTLGALLYAALRAIKRWIREVAAPAEKAAAELQSRDGTTVAATIEQTSRDLQGLNHRLDEQAKEARETRDIALDARARANAVGERLDQHLIREHGAHALLEEN